jgi:hypothetical protein
MAKLYVTEFERPRNQWVNIANTPPLVDQTPVVIGAGSLQSAAFNAKTAMIRVATDAICSIAIGTNPTATTNNMRMAADQVEYFSVQPNQLIAVIANT